MIESMMEEKVRAEAPVNSNCARTNHINDWHEGSGRSPWYSEGKEEGDLPAKHKHLNFRRWTEDYSYRHIPSSVSPKLLNVIQEAKTILELEPDWDEEGSPRYSEATWSRTEKFLLNSALHLWQRHRLWLEALKILPGPYGSIDLHWRTPTRELLINVPADIAEPASYYGDDREEGTENAIRGKRLDTSADSEWIFLWLMK